MREIFTYGSVGGAPGNRCFYLEPDRLTLPIFGGSVKLFTTAKSFLGWLAAGDVWR